ncbi:putative acyl-CoA synthetase YngI [Cladophialophora carrionii]|uniref:Putative acyl-CoA synthetase YngI n=1 Tax=Cladophialophora carrionii TaxID=86049 RepID=A0A1C1CBU4_9EURO|nr:putative acyl-CoA synthetase YngI [Cladophialophora carrionii]
MASTAVALQQAEMAITSPAMSIVSGPKVPQLWEETLGELIQRQAAKYGAHPAATFSWQRNHRLSYQDLSNRSEAVARSMLARGLKHGDHIAIMAGNCYQYIETFLAAARIGCPFVVLNNTYTAKELVSALKVVSCKLLFIAPKIKLKDLSSHIESVATQMDSLLCVLVAGGGSTSSDTSKICDYSSFLNQAQSTTTAALRHAESRVRNSDVLNLQFTSGRSTAFLGNLVNNGRFIGDAMALTTSDIICCPPPLFHCFGLVLGFLASFTHGSTIVFPCDQFDASQVLDSLLSQKCTALLGVPTMFIAEIEANKTKRLQISGVRTGLAAGSSVSPILMKQLEQEFGIRGMLIAYGMTETSPVTFITSLRDDEERKTQTVGRVLPHTTAKVVDRDGNIVPRGVRGELCTSGYALQKGYFNNLAKTAEVMKRDDEGVLWMYTGDECVIDSEGYCSVTGRIKDIIIRGGENIFPHEIESLLSTHPSIAEASVVAIRDPKYGEVVSAFLRGQPQAGCLTPNVNPSLNLPHDPRTDKRLNRPSWSEINHFVRQSLGSHKAPKYVFWIGDEGVGNDFPKTGSGKIMKHVLRDVGERLVKQGRGGQDEARVKARL